MNKIISMLMLSILTLGSCFAQTYKVKISNMKISYNKQTIDVSQDIQLELTKGKSKKVELFQKDDKSIYADFELKTFNSPRSSSKSTGIKIETTSHCKVGSSSDSRYTEYIVFIENTGEANVKELFTPKVNKKAYPVKITYTLTLEE